LYPNSPYKVTLVGQTRDGTIYPGNSVGFSTGQVPVGSIFRLNGQGGCIGDKNGCIQSTAVFHDPHRMSTSPDGKFIYVPGNRYSVVMAFSRDPITGSLTQLPDPTGCMSSTSTQSGACTRATGLGGAYATAVSPDGNNLYVASYNDGAVAAFSRNTAT